ncbi:hypothetical protein [Methylobacterium sp. 17Sr1-1]|uniref:hypothetical protein n=1 Tax=Methylobacterium sp. 17Sr1-1 TaxID=2202826 RepID=UPI0013A54AE6|nr:hypothetical protein [Methylobacterium sp. 17Sr1-1]
MPDRLSQWVGEGADRLLPRRRNLRPSLVGSGCRRGASGFRSLLLDRCCHGDAVLAQATMHLVVDEGVDQRARHDDADGSSIQAMVKPDAEALP